MIHFSPDRVRPRRPTRRTNAQVFAWPLALALASLLGLISGLTGDGIRDLICWVLLGLVPLVIIGALARRRYQSNR